MVQGRKLSLVGTAEHILVEVRAVNSVLKPHDAREVRSLDWQSRALAALGPLVEANGTETQVRLYRALVVNAHELQRENVIEDLEHASLFTVAEAVA